jgi:hypothetical protein
MKRSISVLVFLAIVATGAFAQEFSMSAGGGFQSDYGIPLQKGMEGYERAIGIFGFFDVTYAELSIALGYGQNTDITGSDNIGLQVAALGKYPFTFGSVDFFPLLGARFVLPVWVKEDIPGFNATDMAYIGVQGGAGFDFFLDRKSFTRNFFIRCELLLDLDFKGFSNFYDGADTIQRVGPTFKLGVGRKF